MEAAILVLVLLACVAASAVIVRVLHLPLPLTQIALGAALAVPSFGLHVELEPHLFMLLFIPPLLFADGWRIPKREFFQMRERILALALGLVLFTVLAVGYLLDFLIPEMPLAAAFALAAVLSPTDAVAVSALAGRAGIPKRLMYILEGEALMNDASGLTAFNFAIAAAMTGAFSLQKASLSFTLVALGGLAVGAALGWAMAAFQKWLASWTDVEAQGTIVMILLLPFAAYLVAEEMHVSGILAAVAAGMTLNLRSASLMAAADSRIATTHIWQMLQYVLNGVIFVLMGLQLPELVGQVLQETLHEEGFMFALRLLGYAFITSIALILARLVWVWAAIHVTHFYGRWRGDDERAMPQWRLIVATALAGVRGAITLAGVLSVPLFLEDGSLFPTRTLMIFIATCVILISLVAAAVGLPLLLKGMTVEDDHEEREEHLARLRAVEAAIATIAANVRRSHRDGEHSADADAPSEAAARVIEAYQRRLRDLTQMRDGTQGTEQQDANSQKFRLLGLQAERAEIRRMHRADEINDVVLNHLIYELDVRETALRPRARGAH